MTDPFMQQLARERHAELVSAAEQRRLARIQPEKEPLVRIRFTFELQLGRRRMSA